MSYQMGSAVQQQYAHNYFDVAETDQCPVVPNPDDRDLVARAGLERKELDPSPNEVVILAMYSSGSNLLHRHLRNDIEIPSGIELCKDYSGDAYCGGLWTHTHPARLSEAVPLRGHYGSFTLATAWVLVRHPFALIHSILKRGPSNATDQKRELVCKGTSLSSSCVFVDNRDSGMRIPYPICDHKPKPSKP